MNTNNLRAATIRIKVLRKLPLLTAVLAVIPLALPLRADEPYARTRDYDLQHSRISLRFDLEQKKVIGEVTHSVSLLRDNTSKIAFDSVGLTIQTVTVNKSPVQFETTSTKLLIPVGAAAKAGSKFDVTIRYEGKPSKGLYFILPDKDYPSRPKQIWSQGESEDTRYYLPTYDYPNDRLTTETILTVPASWTTIANGKLISVTDAANSMKTWTWKESLPSSTYLITVVAGELDEVKDVWRGIPVTYYAPKGRGDRLALNFGRTPAMIDLFSKKLGVVYPWEKYSQAMVDDFVAGGMENSSATTNTSSSLVNPKLAGEYATGQDPLISHELGHQWFGDLVTCRDWGHVWLNEGFATFMETMWSEAHFPKDQSEYERWTNAREWFGQSKLFAKPIVRHDFDDSSEFDGNAYNKGGWVLYMLRQQLGEENFYRGLKHYLEVNRGKNVVTADLVKAIEEATHVDVEQFFNQWVYGAGAPKFSLSYVYDDAKHQVALSVKQTQKLEGRVGLFRVPLQVEVTTAAGAKSFPIVVAKDSETFTFPAASAPLMVLFDKGGQVLKSAEFRKDRKEWLYQLKNAGELSDRGDAIATLGKLKKDGSAEEKQEVISALGDTVRNDKAWGLRATAADTLGRIGGAPASRQLLEALDSAQDPWVRNRIVSALGNFKGEDAVAVRLKSVAAQDNSFRARAAALQALGKLKAADAFGVLSDAVKQDSPDDFLRNAALRSFGALEDLKAVPLLREWSVLAKPIESRVAAISSLGKLDKENKEITKEIASYLPETHFQVRMAAIYSLGARGDASAVPQLEELLKRNDLSIEVAPTIKSQIARLKSPPKENPTAQAFPNDSGDDQEGTDGEASGAPDQAALSQRLEKLENLLEDMSDRLKHIESRLSSKP